MRVRYLVGALALCLGTAIAARAPEHRSEAEFTRDLASRILRALPGRFVEIVGELQLRLGEGEKGATVNLDRIYNFCSNNAPDQCEETVATFVAGTVDMASLPEAVTRDQLRLAVRHADFCNALDRLGETAAEDPQILFRPVAPQLCAVLMADFPTTMRSIGRGDLESLGLEAEAAWELARRQTLADLPDPEQFTQLADGLLAVTEYDYIPSLALDTAGWRRAAEAAGGEIVIAIPSDDLLVAIRRDLLGDLDGFKATTREGFETGLRGISPLVYLVSAEGLVPLD